MNPFFKDIEHEQFYEGNLRMTHSQHDPYRQAFFYILGITPQTCQHIHDLYDYEEQAIRLEGLEQGWQTSTSVKMTRLAFSLYNGYTGDAEAGPDHPRYYSPYHLFDTVLMPYFFEVIKIRYAEYARSLELPYFVFPTTETEHYASYEHEA
ncbi:DUF6075 family protein [Paenibacillus terrae]|uniref:Uncharacterized protein n=1 Tax=Paenibacillus terrae (strain HPL-003) TaxID=985665 RepID=G7VZK2_PAETH|nr:DUF6075 family protein [Paenibacillus terrae]AET57244.1 hypothetical protein HPL003_02315 [Paenibacillus terrae HPL-003]